MRKILAVFAHPDDEAFGPGGTLAKYASQGVEIHLLCATKGQAGQWGEEGGGEQALSVVREQELHSSAGILGVKKVEFLNFIDGQLCNAVYHDLAIKIIHKIRSFKPDILLTNERRGVSGHLDHIAVSMITTYAHLHTKIGKKLYYYCLSEEARKSEGRLDNYFVYFPEGYSDKEITTKIDYSRFGDYKVAAMKAHKSQMDDVKFLLARYKRLPKTDFFIRAYPGYDRQAKESDLFEGM